MIPTLDFPTPLLGWMLGMLGKGTLVLIATAALAGALRRASAAQRHLVWTVGLVSLLTLPVLSASLPWRVPVVTVPAPPVTLAPLAATVDRPAAPVAAQPAEQPALPAQPAISTAATPNPSRLPAALAALWLAGALVLVIRLAIGAVFLRRVTRGATALTSQDWTRPLLEAADRLGLARVPRLLLSDRLPMPYASGLLRPTIVLPASAAGWSDRRRRAVLCHELAHLRRGDLVLNALGQLACAAWWPHPLAWVAVRRLRAESERAADDLVLGLGTRASEYADHLLQIVCGAARARTPAVALPMAQRHEFEGRVLAILGRDARREAPSRRHTATFATLATGVVVLLATLGVARAAAPREPTASPVRGAAADSTATAASRDTRDAPSVPAAAPSETPTGPAPTTMDTPADDRIDPATLATVRPAQDTGMARVGAALAKALDDPVADVREGAAHALGTLRLASAAPALTTRLATDPSPATREMAAWALGRIRPRGTATSVLGDAVREDSSVEVRATAVWALGQLEDPAAVPSLSQALADPSADVRARAAWALGTIGERPAPPALVEALGDESAEVRETAAWALGQIEDPDAVAALTAAMEDDDGDVRRAVFWALSRMPRAATESALLQGLEHQDPEIRAQAARALGGGASSPWPWPWPDPRP